MRIAIGGIVQESNSFSPVTGSWAHFAPEQFLRGAELIAARTGTASEYGGLIAAAARSGATLVPLMHAMATASAGPLEAELFAALRDDLLGRLRDALPVDAVLLVLHGAMLAEGCDDATGEVLARARALVGPSAPIVATLDLHANVTDQMARSADALIGYRTAPHIDMFETGERAIAALDRLITSGRRPTSALRRIPMIVPAENGRTTDGPYAEVMAEAIRVSMLPGVIDASVFHMQPWLDVPDVGCSVTVTTEGDAALAQREADRLARMLWERCDRFAVDLAPAEQTIQAALASDRRPWILADSADAPSSGAPGDSSILPGLLIGANPRVECLANIVDAQAVARIVEAGVGAAIDLSIGAGSGSTLYRPIRVSGRVRLLSDGAFTHHGRGFEGVTFYRGRTAVLQIGQLHLVIMERPVLQWDPELYRSVGLEPARAQIVVVKSPAAFRAAYAPFAAEIRVIDAPGVCSPNIAALPYRRIRRPLYPFDRIPEPW